MGGGSVLSGGAWAVLGGIGLWLALLVVLVVVRNTTPRVRTDQAVRFFWGPVTVAALAAVGLASVGW